MSASDIDCFTQLVLNRFARKVALLAGCPLFLSAIGRGNPPDRELFQFPFCTRPLGQAELYVSNPFRTQFQFQTFFYS